MRSEWGVLVPAMMTAAAGLAVLLAEALVPRDRDARPLLVVITTAAVVFTGLFLGADLGRILGDPVAAGPVLGGTVVRDAWGLFVQTLVWGSLALTLLLSDRATDRHDIPPGEYYGLLHFAASGMMLLAVAHDLMMIFLGIEILSVSVYVLSALPRGSARAAEGGMKYFVLGGLGSALLLYGMAMAYGASGTIDLAGIAARPGPEGLARLGMGLILVGLAFKIGAVPFHMWVPDVYAGSKAVVAGFMAAAVKVAAFGALARILFTAYPVRVADWTPLLGAMAALSLVLGNLAALGQRDLKRMLAYSSIAHTGFALLGLVAGGMDGLAATAFYLFVYALMTLGLFGVLASAGRSGADLETLEDCAGLARRHPLTAATLTILLASMTGLPPVAGFFAKLFIFRAALAHGQLGLVILGVLGALLSAYYYLRPVVAMYMQEPVGTDGADGSGPGAGAIGVAGEGVWAPWAAIGVVVGGVIAVGLLPGTVLDLATHVVTSLLGR
jgi:NADH-quinone oxidoreductase subunit N